MAKPLKIDFVSDVVCPWCIVGLGGLETALKRLDGVVDAQIHFQPFELNPDMPAEGRNSTEYIAEKYGRTLEEIHASRQMIKDRAGEVGFAMNTNDQSRSWNTFDAHRLLHWAGETSDKQAALKHALFETHFTDQKTLSDPEVLVAAAAKAGLDPVEAREVLESGRYAADVRQTEDLWRARGINSVPAIIINEKWLISGGQPADAFEAALREIAAQV